MITTCHRCKQIIFIAPGLPVGRLEYITCKCGHSQPRVSFPSLLEPVRIGGERLFPWLPEGLPRFR